MPSLKLFLGHNFETIIHRRGKRKKKNNKDIRGRLLSVSYLFSPFGLATGLRSGLSFIIITSFLKDVLSPFFFLVDLHYCLCMF